MSQDQQDPEDFTLEVDLSEEEAEQIIADAASARESLARKYLLRLLRRHPDARPAQIVRMLEKHYSRSIMAAGWIVSAGTRAADAGQAMIPGGGLVVGGVKKLGERFVRKGAQAALGKAAELVPAGSQQLQFELTALFALALIDLQGIDLDDEQAKALVMGLSNKRLKHKILVRMTQDAAGLRGGAGGHDASAWAMTLAEWLPAGHATRLHEAMKTGLLTVEGQEKPVADYGLRIRPGDGISFAFGRAVVKASREAFAAPPTAVPAHLTLALAAAEEGDDEGNRATEAMEEAAKVAGQWMVGTAKALGENVSSVVGLIPGRLRGRKKDKDLPGEQPAGKI